MQIRILTVSDEQKPYAQEIASLLEQENIRIEMDHSGDTLSSQIKSAQLAKIPWMLVIGRKEASEGTVTLRYHDGKQVQNLTKDALKKMLYSQL